MVATDGSARLLDFGVAKATMAAHVTRDGTFKGKLAYSAPEQVRGQGRSSQSDVYALAVVLWELLVGHRMHGARRARPSSSRRSWRGKLPTITEALGERGRVGRDRQRRVEALLETLEPIVSTRASPSISRSAGQTAAEMEEALAEAVPPASPARSPRG